MCNKNKRQQQISKEFSPIRFGTYSITGQLDIFLSVYDDKGYGMQLNDAERISEYFFSLFFRCCGFTSTMVLNVPYVLNNKFTGYVLSIIKIY
jgi:hypothetical protein